MNTFIALIKITLSVAYGIWIAKRTYKTWILNSRNKLSVIAISSKIVGVSGFVFVALLLFQDEISLSLLAFVLIVPLLFQCKKITIDSAQEAAKTPQSFVSADSLLGTESSVPIRKARRISVRGGGKWIDTIQFDYVNSKGEFMRRHLKVSSVDDEHIYGFDLFRKQSRTFKFDNVIGDIISETTGEVLNIEDWRDSL